MSEDDGGLSGHDWSGHGGAASPGASDSEQEHNPDAPSAPIQKRRRVTRACDECRRKKIKCDGKQPCTHCSVYSYECTYDKPSNRRRNPAPQYIEALEGRLQRAETLLRKFMPDVDLADPNLDPAVQQEFHTREQARARAGKLQAGPHHQPPPSSSADSSNDAQLVSMIDSAGQLDIDDKGGWDFHGISSGSMFLKRMKEHFKGKLGPSAKLPFSTRTERPSGLTNLDPPTPVGQSPFSSVSNYAELPSKEVTRTLCYYSLSCATCLIRIVHLPSFYEKLDKIYDRPVDSLNQEETHFLGLVYSVLALGCMYDSLDGESPHKMGHKEATDEGMKYYKSARALLQDITECRDLTSLQALLFIILFLQATSNLSACYAFVGIALRSALRMGLHRHLQHEAMSTIEDETRRRVFYVIRQMDIYVSTLLGFPLMLNIDDVDQPYPTELDDDFITPTMLIQPPPGSPSSFYVAFNAHTRLMEILAKITKYVYPMKGSGQSVKSAKSSKSKSSVASYSISYTRIKEIEADLHTWFEKLPETWRPSSDGDIEMVRVRHLLRFVYAHVQLVLYRPFLHYVSPRLSQGTKIDELSYACAAAAISVSRNIVHIGLEIRKQRVLSGPYWFMLYTEFFAVLSLVFYAIENPEKPGSTEVLADARAGRQMIAELADKSLAAEKVSNALKVLFDQLPDKFDPSMQKQVASKKRSAPAGGKPGPVPMFSTGRQSSVSSQRTEELARARNGGRPPPPFGTPPSRGSADPMAHMTDPRYQDHSFTGSMAPDMLGFDMSSRATSGSPSTASSSQPQQPYGVQHGMNSHNPVHKLDNLMFPSEDPFAYPNQPMMELGFQPPVSTGSQPQQNSQFFMPSNLEEMDSQLLGQPPPYVIQHPEGQPGLEFSTMYDPNLFNVNMGQQHSQPPSTSSQSSLHSHTFGQQPRRVQPRRQERQIDQIFTENGMQADWGSFFGSGRGVFQGICQLRARLAVKIATSRDDGAPSTDLLAFFSQVRAEGGIVVEELPKLDIESYISNYEGRTRFDRLLHIGRTSIPLSLDALKAAIAEAKAGSDVTRYLDAWDNIRKAAPGDPDAVRDEDWIRSKGEANKKETARLEAELRRYRNNLIKESIRMGYEDLGHHLEETGLLKEALEIYGKMRQEVSSTKHIMDCSQRLIGVNLQRREWTNVLTNVGKIAAISGVDEDRGMQPYVKIIYGVGYLGLGKFAEAARYFPQTDSTAPAHTYNDIVTPNDVAIYGGLTALATLERRALQARILDNAFFRVFLEHEPHIRKAITHFVNGRYSNCLTILAEHEADYLMDIYLARHVKELFGLIRRKCIVQYFIPFSCVTLQSLDEVFASNGQSIEKELVGMIRDGSLNARIDAKSKLLVAQQADPRLKMQHNALSVARKYEEEAKERLRRINIVAAGLEIPAPKKSDYQPDVQGDIMLEGETAVS